MNWREVPNIGSEVSLADGRCAKVIAGWWNKRSARVLIEFNDGKALVVKPINLRVGSAKRDAAQ